MEFQFELIFTLFLSIALLVPAVRVLKGPKAKNSSTRLPPGPWKLPILGNIYQLISADPRYKLRDLANKHGPLMHLQLGEVSTIVVTSREIAREVTKTHDTAISNRPFLLASKILSYDCADIVFAPYGNFWRHMRKICAVELLSTNRVLSFKSIREEVVSAMIKSIDLNEGSKINLSEKIFSLTYGITSRVAFGSKSKDQEAFISIVKEITKLTSGFSLADMFPSSKLLGLITGMGPKLEKLHKVSDKILENIVQEHRERRNRTAGDGKRKGEQDLVDVLLHLQQNGDLECPLTDNNIKAVILDIFFAGSETSSTTVEWAMSELLKNSGLMKEAQAEVRRVFDTKGDVDEGRIHELKLLKLIIKETLRLHPPAPLLVPRECSETCMINGYEIPAKTKVVVNAWAIQRDPKYWKEAEKFNPERFLGNSVDFRGTNFEFIPFGAGRRMCPGISFALPNIELPLANLLYHFDWKLPDEMKHEDLDMVESFSATVKRKNDLLLIPVRYQPSKTIQSKV